jgi:hypothetical protein
VDLVALELKQWRKAMTEIPYAESILNNRKTNQWFVQFFKDQDGLRNQAVFDAHTDWFNANLLSCRMVTSVGAPTENTGFYHVNFVNQDDPRLALYQQAFENDDGSSKHTESYQLYEWDYNNWVERGGPLEFAEFEKNKTR